MWRERREGESGICKGETVHGGLTGRGNEETREGDGLDASVDLTRYYQLLTPVAGAGSDRRSCVELARVSGPCFMKWSCAKVH